MDNLTPITREEMLMNDEPLTPITREEKILAGEDLTPVTRREYFLKKYRHAGGEVMVEGLEVTANGTYTAPEGKAYSPVEVAVPMPENAYLLKEASGSLVSFADGADLPMPSFVCNIDAVQDLHGYDAPWVGGAGKNKLFIADKTATTVDNLTITPNKDADGNINGIKLNGSLTRISYGYEFFDKVIPSGTYILNADFGISTQSGAQILLYNDNYSTTYAYVRPSNPSVSFTLSSDTKIRAQLYTYKDNNYSNIIIKPMIRLATVTDSAFAPYENICPISGHTGVDAWVRGKNLLPMTVDGIKTANGGANTWTNNEKTINGITFTILTNNVGEIIGVNANGTATADAVVTILVDTSKVYGDLYFVGCNGGSNNTYNALMWDATTSARAKKWDGTTASNNSVDGTFQQVKIVQGNNVKFQLRVMNGKTVNNVIFQPMICLSTETDPTFAPYNPQSQTIQVSWQTEAGEVYGGYVDLVSGVLTVTHKSQTSFTRGSQDSSNKLYNIGTISDIKAYTNASVISPYFIDSMFEKLSVQGARAAETPSITHYNKALYVGGYIGKETELDTLLESLQVKYELETPITYQLTPTQIKSLLGNNNAWCSTGDVNIDYFAKEV